MVIKVGVNELGVGVNVGVNNMVLSLLNKNPNLTAKELSNILNKAQRTIERAINKLKQDGKIIRIGSNKTGYWEIIKNVNDDV